MQDNFSIHEWQLNEKIKGLDGKGCWKGYRYAGTENGKDKCVPIKEEKQLCNECGDGYMEEGQCMECGYMEEGSTFTDKYNDDPKLKGGQKELPDEVQAGILKKEGMDHEVSMAQASLKSIINSASELMNKIGNEEINLPGWIQGHITNAENYIDQANQGYHELNEVGYSQASYTHMRPFKLEIANIMSQLGALNDKIEQNGPLSEEIVDAIESLGMLISNINTSRKI